MAGAPAEGRGRAVAGPSGAGERAFASGHPALVPVALAALAVAMRAVAWQRSAAIMNDGPTFIALAEQLAAGRWSEALAHPYHPLYPLLIALTKPLFGSFETAGAAVSIASGGLAVAFLYDFLRRSFASAAGAAGWVPAVGALLLAVHPYAVPYSSDVQSEGLYLALFLGAVALAWRTLERPGLGVAAGAGVLSGLAYLTRPEGLGVLLATSAVIGVQALRRQRSVGELARVGAGLALGALVVAGPYLALIQGEADGLRITRKKSAVAIATLDDTALQAQEERARELRPPRAEEGPPPTLAARVGTAAGDIAESARHVFRLDHWILAGLGAAAAGAPPGLRAGFLAVLVGLYGAVVMGLHVTAGYVSMRHLLPPLMTLLGYVALGVPALGRLVLWGPRLLARRGPATPRVALAVGLAILATASALMALRPQRQERAAARAAAEWLAAQDVAEVVAAGKQRDAYYARATYERLPNPVNRVGESWIEVLRARGVRYVIVDESTARRYPEVGDDPTAAADPRLRLLHRVEAHGRWAAVLEVAGAPPPPQ